MLPQALPRQLSQLQAPQPSVFKGVQGCRLPAPKCFRRPCQGNSRSYRPQPSVFKGVQGCRLPAPECFRLPCQGNSRSYRPQPSVFKGVQGCRLPAPKCFRRPCQEPSTQRPVASASMLPSLSEPGCHLEVLDIFHMPCSCLVPPGCKNYPTFKMHTPRP